MRFVPPDSGLQQYPQASPSGDQGVLLDTGWDVHWPGPARIYLSETDIRDVLSEAGVLDRPLVMELLEARGWVSPEQFKAAVADANTEIEAAQTARDEAIAEADGLKLSLARHVTGATVTVGANANPVETSFEIVGAHLSAGGNGTVTD